MGVVLSGASHASWSLAANTNALDVAIQLSRGLSHMSAISVAGGKHAGCTRFVCDALRVRPVYLSSQGVGENLEQKNSVRMVEGCTSWLQNPGLLHVFRLYLAFHQIGIAAILVGRFCVFFLQRLLFLNYTPKSGAGLTDFGWQCLRVAFISILGFMKALQRVGIQY